MSDSAQRLVTRIKNGVILRGIRHGAARDEGAEGIDWINGWHGDDSQDAQAMLAAWKLRGPKAIGLEEAHGLYMRGQMSREAWVANLDQWDAEFSAGERDR
jgi:hypothetical protein